MPSNPTQNAVHVDGLLSTISVAFRQKTDLFIAPKVAPEVPVNHQSDLFQTYDRGDWFRDEAEVRADATESVGSGYNLGTDSYHAHVWAFHKDIGNQALANADPAIDLNRDAAEFVTQRLLIRMERLWAATFFTTGVWATDITGVASGPSGAQTVKWSVTGSDPRADIEIAKRTMLLTTGYLPNVLILGYDVYIALIQHAAVKEQFKYTSSASINADMLATYLNVDRIMVAQSVVNTGAEGGADSYSFIHGKNALFAYVAPAPSLLAPSAMYTFSWRGISAGLGTTVAISRWFNQDRKAWRVEGEIAIDMKVIAADLGYFFTAIVA